MTQSLVREPDPSLITTLHVTYGLHALGLAIGAFGAATDGRRLPFRFAVDHRGDHQLREARRRARYVAGVALTWQIRTFWYALAWSCIVGILGAIFLIVIVGIGIWMVGFFVLGVWAIYRIASGWMRLNDRRPISADRQATD